MNKVLLASLLGSLLIGLPVSVSAQQSNEVCLTRWEERTYYDPQTGRYVTVRVPVRYNCQPQQPLYTPTPTGVGRGNPVTNTLDNAQQGVACFMDGHLGYVCRRVR